MVRKNFSLFLPIFVLVLAALACAGSDPVTMADIPVFEKVKESTPEVATEVEAKEESVIASVIESLKKTGVKEGVTSEIKIYTVPAETDWQHIRKFYDGELGSDWTEDSQLASSEEGFQTRGWTRGRQALVIAWVHDASNDQTFLIVTLFSE